MNAEEGVCIGNLTNLCHTLIAKVARAMHGDVPCAVQHISDGPNEKTGALLI